MSKIIYVRVTPRAKTRSIATAADGTVVIRTPKAPSDGQANDDVVDMLADYFAVPKSAVRIVAGHASRRKKIEISA